MNPNKSSLALPLLLTFIFVSCLLGVYFSQQSQINSLTSRLITPTPTPTLPAKASATAIPTDSTSTWQTYKNDQYGFEFKYPNSWSISPGWNTTDPVTKQKRLSITSPGYEGDHGYLKGAVVDINFEQLSQYKSLNDFIKQNSDEVSFRNYQPQPYIIASKNGFIITTKQNQDGGRYWPRTEIFSKNASHYFWIIYEINDSSSQVELTDITTQILSTFKFITPNTVSDLKTYNNPKFGCSFNYPNTWTYEEKNYPSSLNSICFGPMSEFYFGIAQGHTSMSNKTCTAIMNMYKSWGYPTEELIISGNKVIKAILPGGQNPSQDIVCFEKGENTYDFQCVHNENVEIKNACSTILSTFKFTN